jgi:hypothetical protein
MLVNKKTVKKGGYPERRADHGHELDVARAQVAEEVGDEQKGQARAQPGQGEKQPVQAAEDGVGGHEDQHGRKVTRLGILPVRASFHAAQATTAASRP